MFTKRAKALYTVYCSAHPYQFDPFRKHFAMRYRVNYSHLSSDAYRTEQYIIITTFVCNFIRVQLLEVASTSVHLLLLSCDSPPRHVTK